ncbi:hypothetical protein [Arthrobacter antioxidans]|uniref:hypothetical protein n=1 Tax=Arthrobacter antioxidans TaxID=2895818 RepID=UPI00200040C8|nr:hypothetical protein [Arthrobacter antioxidans]
MMNRTASVLAVVGTIALLGAGAAQAAPLTDSYVTGKTVTVNDGTSTRSGLVVLDQTVLDEAIGADGDFCYDVQRTEDGVYTLTAAALDRSPVVSSRVVVDSVDAAGGATGTTDASTSASEGPATTGLDSAVILWGASGIVALGLGAGNIVVTRRRAAEA